MNQSVPKTREIEVWGSYIICYKEDTANKWTLPCLSKSVLSFEERAHDLVYVHLPKQSNYINAYQTMEIVNHSHYHYQHINQILMHRMNMLPLSIIIIL